MDEEHKWLESAAKQITNQADLDSFCQAHIQNNEDELNTELMILEAEEILEKYLSGIPVTEEQNFLMLTLLANRTLPY